jgi:flagellar assembly protein FliH
MSSRVLAPDDPQPVSPFTWRRVDLPERGPSYVPPPAQAATAAAVKALSPAAPAPPNANSAAPPGSDPRKIEADLREARAAGLREGEAAGRAKAAAELQPVIERLSRSIDEISSLRIRLRREAEQDLIRLALAIARRIIRRELAVDPDAIHGLVLGALEKLQGQEICRVRVHPTYAAQITACLRQRASATPVEVIPDASRPPGTVIFETSRGNLDASVETQLNEIERGLGDRLRNST